MGKNLHFSHEVLERNLEDAKSFGTHFWKTQKCTFFTSSRKGVEGEAEAELGEIIGGQGSKKFPPYRGK